MTIFQHGFFQDSIGGYGMIFYLDFNKELTYECHNGTYSKYMKSGYVSVDNWHLLALKCERNGNNENYSMYIDGTYVKNINIPKNFIVLNPNYDNSYTSGRNINIAIDGNQLTKLLQFKGLMDQLKIYN
jgi:hypothetical protein